MTLQEHILDQKRRYQNVSLSFEQADIVLKLIEGLWMATVKFDPDETEGRKLARAEAEAITRRDVAMAKHKVSYKENAMTEDQIKHMVNRFLGWKLPANFSPDAGISFKADYNEHTAHPAKHEPSGTNLFDATQADAMVRYMIEELPRS